MKTFLFKQQFKRALQNTHRHHRFVTYTKASRILLLYQCGTTKNQAVRSVIERLENDGKSVEAYCFVNAKKTDETESSKVHLLDQKSVNFMGKLDSRIIDEIREKHFDLLIDLSLTGSFPLLHLALFANADMKAGTSAENFAVFDFILDIRALTGENSPEKLTFDESVIFDKIIFYLKNIQTSD